MNLRHCQIWLIIKIRKINKTYAYIDIKKKNKKQSTNEFKKQIHTFFDDVGIVPVVFSFSSTLS